MISNYAFKHEMTPKLIDEIYPCSQKQNTGNDDSKGVQNVGNFWYLYLKLSCDRRSFGQRVLVSDSHLDLTTTFFLSDSCRFLDVEHPL
jgi:hypothetical protein